MLTVLSAPPPPFLALFDKIGVFVADGSINTYTSIIYTYIGETKQHSRRSMLALAILRQILSRSSKATLWLLRRSRKRNLQEILFHASSEKRTELAQIATWYECAFESPVKAMQMYDGLKAAKNLDDGFFETFVRLIQRFAPPNEGGKLIAQLLADWKALKGSNLPLSYYTHKICFDTLPLHGPEGAWVELKELLKTQPRLFDDPQSASTPFMQLMVSLCHSMAAKTALQVYKTWCGLSRTKFPLIAGQRTGIPELICAYWTAYQG